MTELSTKDKVLLAIYKEYQKSLPNMKNNINPKAIGVGTDEYKVAMEKLDNEEKIKEVSFTRGGQGNRILLVHHDNLMITPTGISYVETNLL